MEHRDILTCKLTQGEISAQDYQAWMKLSGEWDKHQIELNGFVSNGGWDPEGNNMYCDCPWMHYDRPYDEHPISREVSEWTYQWHMMEMIPYAERGEEWAAMNKISRFASQIDTSPERLCPTQTELSTLIEEMLALPECTGAGFKAGIRHLAHDIGWLKLKRKYKKLQEAA